MNRRIRKSESARAVARDVNEHVAQGKLVVMGEIMKKHGYSPSQQKNPRFIMKTQSYIEETQSYADQLNQHRAKVLKAMSKKNLDKEEYKVLADAQAKLTHDVQLLTGGKTENVAVQEDKLTLMAIVAEIRGLSPAAVESRILPDQEPFLPEPEDDPDDTPDEE